MLCCFPVAFDQEDFNHEDFKRYTADIPPVLLANNNFIIQIVAQLLIKWEILSRFLGLSDATVEEIKQSNPSDYAEQKYQCIKHWTKQKGESATLKHLLWVMYFYLQDKQLVMKITETLKHKGKCNSGEYKIARS